LISCTHRSREEFVRVNIYLPDDLAADIKAELGEANISGIAQNALRAELARARGLQALADEGGFQRVEAVDRDEDVVFRGRKIGSDDGRHLTAYVTPKGNIAVVDGSGNLLDVYDESQAFIDDYGDSDRPGTQEMVCQVTKALGLKSVRELDI
jgi:post-segregation antitoxin (ccd killing protein)